jgi:hypothetical protein
MRKKLILVALLVLAAPAVWLGSGGNEGGQDYAFGFGKKIAGAWLATLDIGQPVDVMMTLAADGNVIASGQLRWAGPDGTGGWMGTRYNTTAHGSWQRTDRDGIKLVALLLIQDNDGNVVMYERVRMELTFNNAETRMHGTGSYQLILAGNDPLDPKAPVFAEGPFTETLRLLQ